MEELTHTDYCLQEMKKKDIEVRITVVEERVEISNEKLTKWRERIVSFKNVSRI